MPSVKSGIALTILLSVLGHSAEASKPAAGAKGSDIDPMGVMLEVEASRYANADDCMCEKAARTKAFEEWVEDFTKGDLKSAEKHWGEVLIILRKLGSQDGSRLYCIANERTVLEDTKTNGNILLLHLLSATEHSMGPRDLFTATACRRLAMQLEGSSEYSKALDIRKRELSILEEKSGADSAGALNAKKWVKRDTSALAFQKAKAQ